MPIDRETAEALKNRNSGMLYIDVGGSQLSIHMKDLYVNKQLNKS